MTVYYNEFDPFAAAWLEALIDAGAIAYGVVDRRSIVDVEPVELLGYSQLHFFAGIGVWSYACRTAGWRDDRRIISGSCPCQPFSSAGKGGGFDDERHLWPAFHHIIESLESLGWWGDDPIVIVGEQVASKDGLAWLDLVQTDMEAADYAFGAVDICAAGFGAPHIRQRLGWLAYAASSGERPGFCDNGTAGEWWSVAPDRQPICDVADGVGHGSQGRAEPILCGTGRRVEGYATGRSGEPLANRLVGDPKSRGRGEFGDEARAGGSGYVDGPGGALVGLADSGSRIDRPVGARADFGGLSGGYGTSGAESRSPGPTNGAWRDADWLYCRDGRWRPVEPATQPLAHGATNRVGALRGYGNAIPAPWAIGFIESVMEIVPRS